MRALQSVRRLTGSVVEAADGEMGKVCEFYFDDANWRVRYMVVDVSRWLLHRKVLMAAEVLGSPDTEGRIIPVAMTKSDVRKSPNINTDLPIALQHQARLHEHYGWELYWGAEGLMWSPERGLLASHEATNRNGEPFDPHLRTTRIVLGHSLKALDGLVGEVYDFLMDVEDWTIRQLVIQEPSGNLLLLPVEAVERISFEEKTVYSKYSLDKVRGPAPSGVAS
jgi:hypothetical protein